MTIEEEIKQAKFRNDYQRAAVNLIYTTHWLEARQEELFKPFAITTSQFNILRILRGQELQPISGAEIKSRMLERNSDISRLLDRLEKKKMITRKPCANDKRAADILITEVGLSVLQKIDKHIDQSEKINIHLNREEARQLSHLLDKARG